MNLVVLDQSQADPCELMFILPYIYRYIEDIGIIKIHMFTKIVYIPIFPGSVC